MISNNHFVRMLRQQDSVVMLLKLIDFQALIGDGVGMTVGLIGPYGLNTSHTHPRSAEINIVV